MNRIYNNSNSRFFRDIDRYDVLTIIQKNKRTEDISGVSVYIQKKCGHLLLEALENIINTSLNEACFPSMLKLTRISIYKNVCRDLVQNFSQISVLPCFSKIYEAIIYHQVVDYLNKHRILNPH